MKIMKFALSSFISISATASTLLKVNDPAPLFTVKTHEDKIFNLATRKESGRWTVLYFYPKAETPGCTKQACAFRDNIKKIEAEGADVFGISTDTVKAQADFHKNHALTFTLLADSEGKVVDLYGSKMPLLKMAKRWTFLLDPELKIRAINKDVDPAFDSEQVAKAIADLKKKP